MKKDVISKKKLVKKDRKTTVQMYEHGGENNDCSNTCN